MDTHDMLFGAARDGKIDVLKKLLKESPTILADIKLISHEKSLLHVATKSGQLSFVHEFLNIDPDAAKELNKDGFRPLDIAVIMGNLEIAKEFIKFNGNLVQLKGKDHRTALHYAAIKGRVDVIKELISVCPDSVEDVTVYEETALHLAVKSFQFEAFAVLVKWIERLNKEMMINMEDGDGNTVIHLAVSTKQYMFLEILLGEKSTIRETIGVNAKNAKGLTALDILDIVAQDTYDIKARQILHNAAASRAQDSIIKRAENSQQHGTDSKLIDYYFHSGSSKNWFEYFKFQTQRDSPSDTRNALLVVAALIATVTFQAGVNPPNGIFKPQTPPSNNATQNSRERPFIGPAGGSALAAGSAIFGSHATSFMFLFSNSLGLISSMCIIIYLTAGFPFKRELHISMYSVMFTYGVAVDIIIKGIEAKSKAVAYALVTVAFVLPFVQRWLPRWGKKAWRKWRKKATEKTLLPVES